MSKKKTKSKPATSDNQKARAELSSSDLLCGNWKTWLRENGRWSLWHKIKRGNRTVCGWSYSAKLESKTTDDITKQFSMTVCRDCATSINTGDGMKLSLPYNVEFRNAASGAPGLDGGVQ